jgi:hypothetical protein
MSGEAILGVCLLGVALSVVSYLVVISRSTIERIADSGNGSAREILNDRR